MNEGYFQEQFTLAEEMVLRRFFTNTDGPVFALINLPEVVKGALFARYSRTHKSLRRLFLDEFYENADAGLAAIADEVPADDPLIRLKRAEALYERVFSEYGDDSVAQLGGAHLACEQASNILTKVLEWGRLAAYLEQSTRYIFYDRRLGGRFRYTTPPEVAESDLADEYAATMEWLFEAYSGLVHRLFEHFAARFPRQSDDSATVWRSSIRAKACDAARGLLPAATLSNVGIFATGQAYEALLLRMRAHPLQEARGYSRLMLAELRKVIPAFVRRVDQPDRGGLWSDYLRDTAANMAGLAERIAEAPAGRPEVTLVEWDQDAEIKIAAAALYASSGLPDDQLLSLARELPAHERAEVIRAYVGERKNRRHRPGRALERSYYRFDVALDFGSFRDLQRHRMLTIEWQRLGTGLGYATPDVVREVGGEVAWDEAMARTDDLHSRLERSLGADPAQYVVPFAYRIRFVIQMNAREAFHLLELRTGRQGHPDYRRACQEMHRLIRDQAGHRAIAEAMSFVDYEGYDLARLEAERRAEDRRGGPAVAGAAS